MNSADRKVSRLLVGFLAAAFLLGGLALAVIPATSDAIDPDRWDFWQGVCVRVGLVLAALWLALPTLQKDNPLAKAMGGAFVGVMLMFVFLRRVPLRIVIPVGIVLGLLGIFLRPKPKHRPGNRPPGWR